MIEYVEVFGPIMIGFLLFELGVIFGGRPRRK
jgi:hypothetical protein